MGNEQQNEGKLEQVAGDIKEGVGNALGNDQMKREGQWDQAKGQTPRGRRRCPRGRRQGR